MRPLNTLYEIVGFRFPVLSQVIAFLVGGIVFGFGWYSLARHYRNEQAKNPNVPSITASRLPAPNAFLNLARLLNVACGAGDRIKPGV